MVDHSDQSQDLMSGLDSVQILTVICNPKMIRSYIIQKEQFNLSYEERFFILVIEPAIQHAGVNIALGRPATVLITEI